MALIIFLLLLFYTKTYSNYAYQIRYKKIYSIKPVLIAATLDLSNFKNRVY